MDRHRPAQSRKVPCLCKVAPNIHNVHMEDVHRAGGIFSILGELSRAGLLHNDVPTVHSTTMGEAIAKWDIKVANNPAAEELFKAAPGGVRTTQAFSQANRFKELDTDREGGGSVRRNMHSRKTVVWRFCSATLPKTAAS